MVVVCAGCDKPILDRFLMNVLERAWHPSCVTCAQCDCELSEKCFSRDGKLYCKTDFFRQFGTKCAGCSNGIAPNELVRKARDKLFHLKCFICGTCHKQLSTGEQLYVLNDCKFLCKIDYMNRKYGEGTLSESDDVDEIPSNNESADHISESGEISDKEASLDGDGITSPHTEDSSKESNQSVDINRTNTNASLQSDNSINNGSNNNNSDKDDANSVSEDNNGNKRRGPRTTIKAKQLETLKAAFAATPKPTRHIREQLAVETGLNMRVIQVWFQNRRSKERRLKQMSSMGSRRPFFGRSPRRLRGSHMDDSPDMPPPYGFYQADGQADPYYSSMYPSYPQDFYSNQLPSADSRFMAGSAGAMEMSAIPHSNISDVGPYMPDIMRQASPDGGLLPMNDTGYPRSSGYNPLSHHPPPIESW